ncbi:MAG: AAA family ATPase [Muribaculum sp.]|nr:AAA family ATPase [Muribaculum sp.]
MDEYSNFKSLLEYFVSHLEWVVNEDTHHIGYEKYIKPITNFKKSGQGHKGFAIQNQIKPWEKYSVGTLCINVVSYNYQCTGNYVNWKGTWKNVRPLWKGNHVSDLYLSKDESASAKKEYSASIKDLGLFDGESPNKTLIKYFDRFKCMLMDIADNTAACVELLRVNKNLVLTGAPGTGKTHLAKEIARIMDAKYEIVQFHPSYDYTDFVEGLRPEMRNGQVGFKYEKGIFKKFCEEALNNPEKEHVFIIDEINRGELPKIFGELFSAIDPGYRGESGTVKTQYQNLIDASDIFVNGFFVPDNVFIIGTMNDIDRGVESIDFAIRRRFAWKEINVEDRKEMLDILGELRPEAERRMNSLNEAIHNNENLTDDFKIGGAYFLKLTELNFDQLWELYLMPLLKEYLRGTENINSQLELFKSAYEKK